jgi:uncharacterized protein YndB with AHSA1/START domain
MIIFIFIAILFTIGFIATVGLVLPKKTMVINSEVIIDKPKAEVWSYIRLLRNQEKYNTWIMQDPNIKMNYIGTDGTVGFIAGWESRTRMGDGEQEIINVNEGQSYEAELRFRRHENRTHVKTKLESTDGGKTKVTTIMSATPSFPMNLMVPMMRKVLKKNMDENSANLKKILEA